MDAPVHAISLARCSEPYLSLGVQFSSPVTWSHCGEYLAFVASDHSVVVLQVSANVPPSCLPATGGEKQAAALQLNDRSADWNTSVFCILHGHSGPVRTLLFSPTAIGSSGSLLFSGGADGVRGWNLVSTDCTMYLPIAADSGAVFAAVVPTAAPGSEQERQAAAAAEADRLIKLHEHDVECMEWIVPDKLLATGSKDTSIKMWDVSRLRRGHAVEAEQQRDPLVGGSRLFGGAGGPTRANGALLVETIDAHKAGLTSVSLHPSEASFASTARDGSVKVWGCKHLWSRFETTQSYFTTPQGQPDTSGAASQAAPAGQGNDREARCEVQCGLEGHRGDVMTASWTPDGTKLLSGGRDNAILVWDVPQEVLLGELRELSAGLAGGHQGDVRAVVPFAAPYLKDPTRLVQAMSDQGAAAPLDAVEDADLAIDLHAISIGGDGALKLWRLPEATFKMQEQAVLGGRDADRLAEEAEVERILADILSGTELDPNAKTDSSQQRTAESLARTAGESEYVPLQGVQVLQSMVPPCDAAFSDLTASGLLRNDATQALSAPQATGDGPSAPRGTAVVKAAGPASTEPDANYGLASLAIAGPGHAAALTTSGGTLFIISLLPPAPAVLPCMQAAAASQRWAYAMAQQLWVARSTCHRGMVTGLRLLHQTPAQGDEAPGSALLLSASTDGCVVLTDTGSNAVVCDSSVGTRITAMASTEQPLAGIPQLFPHLPQASLRLILVGTADYSVRVMVLASQSSMELQSPPGAEPTKGQVPAMGRFLEVGALLGHEGQLTAVQVSPCGRLAVTAAADLTVRVWDLRPILRILGGEAAKSVSKDSGSKASLVAGAGQLPAVLLSCKHCIRPHTGSVQALSLEVGRQGEMKLVTAGDDHKVKLWQLSALDGSSAAITAPSIVWKSDSSASLQMATTGMPELGQVSALPHNGSVQAAMLAPTGSPLEGLLFTGGWDKLIGVWVADRLAPAVQTLAAACGRAAMAHGGREAPLAMLSGHTGRITAIQVSHVDAQLLTGDSDGMVLVWALSDGRQFVPTRRFHSSLSASMASVFGISRLLLPSSSSDFFFTGSAGGGLQAWPLRAPSLAEYHSSSPAESSDAPIDTEVEGGYSAANRDALLTMARRASGAVPGSSRAKRTSKDTKSPSGLRMMGPLRAGSLRSLQVAEMEAAASAVGRGVLPSIGRSSRGSVLQGSGGAAPVLGRVGRTASSFNFAVQDGTKASLQRRGASAALGAPSRRPSVSKGGSSEQRAATVVTNPLLARAASAQRNSMPAVTQPAAPRSSVASSQQGAAEMQSAMACGTPALPGGMQVQESPLHVRASTHAPAVNSSVTPPDLQAGALVAPEEGGAGGGHQPDTAQGTVQTEGATQGFQPTQPRKGQAAAGDSAEGAAAGKAMVAAATAAV